MSDADLSESAEAAPARHDHKPKNAAPKTRKKREAKPRYDSPAEMAVDGWGEPFEVECAPGYVAYWASDFDRNRMTRRRWSAGTWGDPRVISYHGAVPGKKGEPIKHRELSLMIMTTEDAAMAKAYDPRLQGREELRDVVWKRARASGDGHGRTGRVEQVQRNVNFAR